MKSGVRGQRRLSRILRNIRDEFGDGAISPVTKAVAYSADLVAKDAASRAPIGSGELARHMLSKQAVRISRSGLSAKVGIIGKRANRRLYYAKFIEFGTKGHPPRKGKRRRRRGHPGTPARPFLRPALEANGRHISAVIDRAVDDVLDRAARALF